MSENGEAKKPKRKPRRPYRVGTEGKAVDPARLFVEGTPVDSFGNPLTEAEISEEEAREMPLDAESSRLVAEHNRVMSLKTGGVARVNWNADYATRYMQITRFHPNAYVRIKQIKPEEHEGIPEHPVSALRDYGALVAYVRDNHWKGDKAEYKWTIFDDQLPSWGTGTIKFAAQKNQEDDMRRGQPPQGGWPPNGYGYQGGPMPGYGYQGAPGYYHQPQPAPQYHQPQPMPAPQPQPPAMPMQIPAGIDPTLATMLQELMRQNVEYRYQLDQMRLAASYPPQYYAPPPPPEPPPPPPPPKSPLEQLTEMSSIVRGVHAFTHDIAQHVGGGTPDAEPPPPPGDPDFPAKFKDIGPLRLMAVDGEVSAPTLYNIDKYKGMLDGFLDKVGEVFDKVGTNRTKSMREQVELMERAEAAAERHRQQQQQRALPPEPQRRPIAAHPWEAAPSQQRAWEPPPAPAATPQRTWERPPPPPPAAEPTPYVHPWEAFRKVPIEEIVQTPPASVEPSTPQVEVIEPEKGSSMPTEIET